MDGTIIFVLLRLHPAAQWLHRPLPRLKSLTDEDCREIWRRYDVDDSNSLDMQELRLLLDPCGGFHKLGVLFVGVL